MDESNSGEVHIARENQEDNWMTAEEIEEKMNKKKKMKISMQIMEVTQVITQLLVKANVQHDKERWSFNQCRFT